MASRQLKIKMLLKRFVFIFYAKHGPFFIYNITQGIKDHIFLLYLALLSEF